MTSSRPYLIRAIYEWISDNYLTPYIIVDAEKKNVHIPRQYVKDGKIILNISASVVNGLEISNKVIQFDARFSGAQMHIYAPVHAVVAIYAKENGRGMFFEEEEAFDDDGGDETRPPQQQPSSGAGAKASAKPKKPNLRVVK